MAPLPMPAPMFRSSSGLIYDKQEMLVLLKSRLERTARMCSALDELIQNVFSAAPKVSENFCHHLYALIADDLPDQIANIEKLPDIPTGPHSPYAPITPTPEQLIRAQDEVNAAEERLEKLELIGAESKLPEELKAIWDLTVKPELEAQLQRCIQHRDFLQQQIEAEAQRQEASE